MKTTRITAHAPAREFAPTWEALPPKPIVRADDAVPDRERA